MTVSSTVSKIQYVGDSVTNNWPITFNINGVAATEIEVYLVNQSTAVSTLLDSNYSVDLAVPEVVYPVSGNPISSDYGVLINRKLSLTQETDYKNQGPLPAETIEEGDDRKVMMMQQLQEQINRTIKADISQGEATLDEITAAAAANAAAAEAAAGEAQAAQAVAEAAEASALAAQQAAEDARDAAQLIAGIEIASQADAEGAVNNTKYMTPLRVKQEVEKSGAVAIPAANITGLSTIPSGIICMWSGTIATVPAGWYFCNGSNGTPDLRDRMIMGANQDDSGVAKTNVSGALTQTGGEAFHTPTVAELAPHAYTATIGARNDSSAAGNVNAAVKAQANNASITGSTDTVGGGQPFNVLNPYYALAFIMKA